MLVGLFGISGFVLAVFKDVLHCDSFYILVNVCPSKPGAVFISRTYSLLDFDYRYIHCANPEQEH